MGPLKTWEKCKKCLAPYYLGNLPLWLAGAGVYYPQKLVLVKHGVKSCVAATRSMDRVQHPKTHPHSRINHKCHLPIYTGPSVQVEGWGILLKICRREEVKKKERVPLLPLEIVRVLFSPARPQQAGVRHLRDPAGKYSPDALHPIPSEFLPSSNIKPFLYILLAVIFSFFSIPPALFLPKLKATLDTFF